MGREEQVEEREVLDSIFPDEITDISDISYRVSIVLDIMQQGDDSQLPTLLLTVTYPESYPDTSPILDISTPPNVPKHALFDIQADRERLFAALQPTIEENIGMAMVFTLVSTLKDIAEVLVAERVAAAQAVKDVEAALMEEEENKKFHGTAVTRKSFLRWREGFRQEMEEELRLKEEREGEERKKKSSKDARLTGKELWERGLVGKVDEDEDDAELQLSTGIQDLRVAV